MWFRNLQLFRLAPEWQYGNDALNEALQRHLFRPCGALDRKTDGWVSPRGENGLLVFSVQGHQLTALGFEEKVLPAAVVRQQAELKLAEIEKAQGFRPGRKQMREVREQMEAELLPKAFTRRRLTYVWIDPASGWLAVDAASAARADEVIEALKLSLGELPLTLLKTGMAPGTAMTQWLATGEAPGSFSIDRDGELQAAAEEHATVRYARHNLDSAEIRAHIASGKIATRLALTWKDRISFVLTETMQIRRLAFLDVLKEDADWRAEAADDLFAASVAIMSGELAAMLGDLVQALGGEAE